MPQTIPPRTRSTVPNRTDLPSPPPAVHHPDDGIRSTVTPAPAPHPVSTADGHPPASEPNQPRATLRCGCRPGQTIAGQHPTHCPITQHYAALVEALDFALVDINSADQTLGALAHLLTGPDIEILDQRRALTTTAATLLRQVCDAADAMADPATAHSDHRARPAPHRRPRPPPAGETVTVRRRLRLPPPYQTVNVAETVDDRTGQVRYRFRATRVTGTVIIKPEFRGEDEPIPRQIFVQFGDGHAYRERDRSDPPRINGVTLTGGVPLSPDEFLARQNGRNLWLRRPTGPYTSISAPDATNRYGSAIIRAIVSAWYHRPDREELIRAAARHTAAARLNELHRRKIAPAQAEIDRLNGELLDHFRLAGELHRLAKEHDELTATDPAADHGEQS